MYDAAISNINSYVVYLSVAACVEDQVSRLHIS